MTALLFSTVFSLLAAAQEAATRPATNAELMAAADSVANELLRLEERAAEGGALEELSSTGERLDGLSGQLADRLDAGIAKDKGTAGYASQNDKKAVVRPGPRCGLPAALSLANARRAYARFLVSTVIMAAGGPRVRGDAAQGRKLFKAARDKALERAKGCAPKAP